MTQLNEFPANREHVRKMKTIVMGALVLLVSGLLVVTPGLAGGKGKHHGHNPEKKLQKLTKRLGLSKEQQAKVKPILEQKHHKLQELHKQMKQVRKNARAQIEELLNPEQVEKYQHMREKYKQGKKNGKGKHGKKHKRGHHNDDDDEKDHD